MADDDWDLGDESVDEGAVEQVRREPISHEERTRRGLLIAAGSVLVVATIVNLALAIALSGPKYAVAGPALGVLMAVAAAVLGSASNYYFTRGK